MVRPDDEHVAAASHGQAVALQQIGGFVPDVQDAPRVHIDQPRDRIGEIDELLAPGKEVKHVAVRKRHGFGGGAADCNDLRQVFSCPVC